MENLSQTPEIEKFTHENGDETSYLSIENGNAVTINCMVYFHGLFSHKRSDKAEFALGKAIGKGMDGFSYDLFGNEILL